MLYFVIKCVLSGIIIATVSEIAKRSPAFGALIVSLPLVSLLGILWLWRDTGDSGRIASHAESTFWYVLPSLPMFLVLARDAPRRSGLLAQHGCKLRPDDCTLLRHRLGLDQVWHQSLNHGGRAVHSAAANVSARAIAQASQKRESLDRVISVYLRTIHPTELNTRLRQCSSAHCG
jgi:hypothetical protein